ncbi:MAG: alanine--tRNA ligase [Desulfuromonadaceae bacterium]|nr:alanine--tRNA ligase [Desulfuromonadaceae bacterium]
MTAKEIRQRFLDYFSRHGHTVVESSSLIPHNDPTLLFTNAGMNQFKDCFLGQEKRDYLRAVSSQKCVRAGGKHNDLENVGRTARHHTFFEMLGNFSFGDYFKKEAIAYAWEFLTVDLGLDKNRLYVTVYTDDDEAADLWHTQEGVPRERIFRFEDDNFWAMGDTGPCGPCSEIFWDNGPAMACADPQCNVGCDCDRYMEIWNNVFMQFNRQADGTLEPLPNPAVDTGMGLERITTVMQGVQSNYDTDLLQGIIRHIVRLVGKSYGDNDKDDVSLRVIADHIRAMTFLIADGALPSNEGRGYVLRRIMRRAARHAKMLGASDPVLFQVVDAVKELMGEAYPELIARESFIKKVIRAEEERFMETLDNGLRILHEEVEKLKRTGGAQIPGPVLFKLYDTYGFPTDLTADIVRQEGLGIDAAGFASCMAEQRAKARENWKGSGEEAVSAIYHQLHEAGINSEFVGYRELTGFGNVLAILKDGQQVSVAEEGDRVEIVTSLTPFYGESGGQTGDRGTLATERGEVRIDTTRRPLPELIIHVGEIVSGAVQQGESAELAVDREVRQATCLNHTATHILQAVLVDVLGDHVKQAGSLVTPERLRFDFTHFSAMTAAEIARVEQEVNRRIRENGTVDVREMSQEDALAAGATALFGEKYGDSVRVVRTGDFSMELCGGTHTSAAGDIGLFRIVQETGIAAGVRRIEALTGGAALDYVNRRDAMLRDVAALVKSDVGQLESRLRKMLEHQKELERDIDHLQTQLNVGKSAELLEQMQDVAGIKVLAVKVDEMDGKALREFSDRLRERVPSGVIVVGCVFAGKVNLLVAVSKDLVGQLHAGNLIKELAALVGGKGGGRPDLAQAGGSEPDKLPAALAAVTQLVEGLVKG